MNEPKNPRMWIGRLLLLLVLAGLIFLGWRGVRTALYARAALADLDRLQTVADAPSLSRLPALQGDLAALESHLSETRAAARPFLAVAPLLGWVPRYGADIAAAPPLLDMAVELAAAGRQAVDALAPLAGVAAEGGGLDQLTQVVAGLQTAAPQLAEAHTRLTAAQQLRARIPVLSIDRLASLLDKLDRLLPLASDGLELAQLAPALLGAGGERSYLVLAQNSDELRATGGFISGVGIVRFENGALAEMTFGDSYSVDNFEVEHPTPPLPLVEQMGSQTWLVRDSNWSPDFPEAAEVARTLYSVSQGLFADGVIALDLEAVRQLVGALGPLQVPGVDEPVTGDNALTWMKRAWEAPAATEGSTAEGGGTDWWTKRKDFMGQLVAAALARLESGGDLDVGAIAQAGLRLLDTRHLQLFIDDSNVTALLAARGWDGAVRPREGQDFLAVVDSNVGFNKANLLVQPRIDYSVEPQDGALVGTAEITYDHTAPAGSEDVCDRSPRYGATYEAMAHRCFWNYLRVYVPGGAELLSSEGLKQTLADVGEGGTTMFAGDFVMRPGEQHVVTLRYRLPVDVQGAPYGLFVRKQAGVMATPVTIQAGPCRSDERLERDVSFTCADVAQP